MRNITRKILIFLLSATCAVAGAAGLSACAGTSGADGKDGKDGLTPSIGENGNWWIGEIDTGVPARGEDGDKGDPGEDGDKGDPGEDGEDGRGIKSIFLLDGEFVVVYTDGTYEIIKESDESPVKLVKARAVDQYGDPVKGAYLKLCKYNSLNYENEDLGVSVTDNDGYASFIYEPEARREFSIRLADHGATESELAAPEGYDIAQFKFVVTGSGSVQNVDVEFRNVDGTFSDAVKHNKVITVPYTRAYNEETSAVNENNGTTNNAFTVELKAGRYTYLSFLPYVKPATSEDPEETAALLAHATAAATGKYELSFSGGDADLYYFSGSQAHTPCDENGIPSIVLNHTGDGTANTTATSIVINNESSVVRGEKILGLISETNCTLTFTVTRTGNADEIPEPELVEVPAPENLSAWANKQANTTLTLMPVTGSFIPVKGTDGFWHVNSATGPHLLARLTEPVSRFLEMSLQAYPSGTDMGESVLYFNGNKDTAGDFDEKGNPLKKYDYNAILQAYCAKVNSDGVYGVDDNLYALLSKLAEKGIGADNQGTQAEYRWLLACYFYSPEGGMPARGSGTEVDPYVIAEGGNLVPLTNLSGTAHFTFVAPSTGVYAFDTAAAANITFAEDVETYKNGNSVYALLTEGVSYAATLSGTEDKYTVTVRKGDEIEPVSGDGAAGITEGNAISVIGTGVKGIIYNTNVLDDGVYIKFSCALGGTGSYTLTLLNDGATIGRADSADTAASSITVDVKNELDLINNTEDKTEVTLVIKAPADSYLMLIITKNQSN